MGQTLGPESKLIRHFTDNSQSRLITF